MPINKSALKRERQDKVRRQRNRIIKSQVRTAFNHLSEAMHSKVKEDVDKWSILYFKEIDKAVKKGVFHKNKGARRKSRMVKKIKSLFQN